MIRIEKVNFMLKGFREFALQGNVFDLAVGVVIGAAFGKIVSSLVENIIMPILGVLLKGINFTNLKIKVGGAEILYGQFIQSIFDFFIIAFSIYLFIRIIVKIRRKKAEEEAEEVDAQEVLLTEIRDLLKTQNSNQRN